MPWYVWLLVVIIMFWGLAKLLRAIEQKLQEIRSTLRQWRDGLLGRLFATPQIPKQPESTPYLAPVDYERARVLAAERRRNLDYALREVGEVGVLSQEFLEIPPGIEGMEPRSLRGNSEQAFAQMARLQWQLEAEERLLVERLVDAFVVFHGQAGAGSFAAEDPLIKLHRDRSLEREGLFPWVATIETEHPELYMALLAPIRNWLGIGVKFAPKSFPQLLANCEETGGGRGSVGGLVDADQRYKMTCDHVLSPNCHSVELHSYPAQDKKDVPDAALIRLSANCFKLPDLIDTWELHCATADMIRERMDDRTSVIKLHGLHKGCPGFIHGPVVYLPAAVYGFSVNFPHLEIKPDTKTYLFGLLTLPFWHRKFSLPGDSGSWAVESKSGSWLGMVVAEDGYKGTYVVEAAPLLEYLERALNAQKKLRSGVKLTPLEYSDRRK